MKEKLLTSKTAGLWIIALLYLVAVGVGAAVFCLLGERTHALVKVLAGDVAATVFIWLCSVGLKNASVYDPYWSVAPPVILLLLAVHEGNFGGAVWLVLMATGYWGVRLTVNWALSFRNLKHQDWRYDHYKNRFPGIWQLINLTGIQLMPTLLVYLASVPAFLVVTGPAEWTGGALVGFLVCLAAATLQWSADLQLRRFRKLPRGGVCDRGLWRWSRHPNYLGEILQWWGLLLICYGSTGSLNLWVASGALAVTFLFVFISIPLMEKRQMARKPEYAVYRSKTGALFPRLRLRFPPVSRDASNF